MAKTRNDKGQFEKGWKGGPGRPKGLPKEREYLDAFRKRVTIDKWMEAVGQQLAKALDGDTKAFEILAKYCLPQPAMMLDMGKEMREAFRIAGQGDTELMEKMAAEVVETFKVHHSEAA